jgi:hypothetical protein
VGDVQRIVREFRQEPREVSESERDSLCNSNYDLMAKLHTHRLRKEKLEENLENEKRRHSENGTPIESPILNLSKNRERSQSPEYIRNAASSPGAESGENLDVNEDPSDDMEVSENSPRSRSQSPSQHGNMNNKMNYHARDFSRPAPTIAFPSTEILLRNIQELLKVVLENSIQQEQQLSFEKGKGNNCYVQQSDDKVEYLHMKLIAIYQSLRIHCCESEKKKRIEITC